MWLWILIGVLALAAIGAALWFFVFKDKDDNAEVLNKDGAESADAAMASFLTSIESDDTDDMLESVSPSEHAYMGSLVLMFSQIESAESQDGGRVLSYEEGLEARDELMDIYEELNISTETVEYEEIELGDGVTALYLTGGTITVEMDVDAVADKFSTWATEYVPELKLDNSTSDQPPTKEELEAEVRTSLEDNGFEDGIESFDVTEENGMIIVMVEEDGEWFFSPMLTMGTTGMMDSVVTQPDVSTFQSLVNQRGPLNVVEGKEFSSPEDAVKGLNDFTLADPNTMVSLLPVAERRFFAAMTWDQSGTGSPNDPMDFGPGMPQIDISGIEADIVDRGSGTKVAVLSDVTLTADGMSVVLDNGTLTVPQCVNPIDVSTLQNPDSPFLAFGLIEDSEGWHISLGATAANFFASFYTIAGSDLANGEQALNEYFAPLANEFMMNCQ